MTKKQKLQKEAKDLEGYSDSLTIAKLEAHIEKKKKEEAPKEEEIDEDPELEPETSEDLNKEESEEKESVLEEVTKIATVKMKRGERELSFEDDKENIIVGEKYTRENDPRAGGYYTKDQDGKEGYISAEDFEKENEE